jgi:hypothetical protein
MHRTSRASSTRLNRAAIINQITIVRWAAIVVATHLAPFTHVGVSGVFCASHTSARWRACMSIKEVTKRASSESSRDKGPHPYVVPESEIRNCVESLGIHDLNTVAVRFQVLADLTSGALKRRVNRLKRSDLRFIEQIAGEDDSNACRKIMTAIIAGVGQGPSGVNAAHLTASRAVELAFRWTREYFSALDRYKKKLRRMRPTAGTG